MATQRKPLAEVGHWVDLRHRLHQIPELAYEEFATAGLIRDELKRLGIDFIAGIPDAPTATIAVVGDESKPCIALRADIDALPITERTGREYASVTPGRMHACGHDGHSTILLATAATLRKIASKLDVCVKLIWQPAEEGGGGAFRLIEAGVLEGRLGPKVEAIFGLHGWPSLPAGTVATKAGALLAATDNFHVEFEGRGCHGAFPHLGRDPIVTAAEAVGSLQSVVSREIDPTEPAVVTVGMIQGGTAVNVIPDRATIRGTARSLSDGTRAMLRGAIERRCRGIAAAHDCEMRFEWIEGYPALHNDPAMAEFVMATAKKVLGASRGLPVARASMGGEDFAYYLQRAPGCFFMLGLGRPGECDPPPLHSDRFDFNDDAIATGVAMFTGLAKGWGKSAD